MWFDLVLLTFGAVFCSIWILMFAYLILMNKRLVRFHKLDLQNSTVQWPRVSIIVPACNEADHIEEAAKSLIKQDYPDLEIILVNDRSTDKTGEIINRLAASNPHVKAVHVDELPKSWLGKVHALHQGIQQATGDWLLFTDADIHYTPDLLRRAIIYASQEKVDHLTLLPKVILKGFWLEVAIRTFGLLFLLNTRADTINRPNTEAVIGVGAFNLVKKETFDKTPGFKWLRLEVVDDMGLGLMIKQAGGQTRFAMAEQDLAVTWYPTISAMFKGLEKNLFGPGPRYQLSRLTLQVGFMWGLLVAPFVALYSSSILLWSFTATTIVMHILFSIICIRENRSETLSLLLFPIGIALLTVMMLKAGYLCTKNKGIDWRGTHYTLKDLKTGQRVKL